MSSIAINEVGFGAGLESNRPENMAYNIEPVIEYKRTNSSVRESKRKSIFYAEHN